MKKQSFAIAALTIVVSAAVLFLLTRQPFEIGSTGNQFVRSRGARFVIDGRPFRFVGANVSVMYRDEDRARMPETMKRAAQAGIKVVRVWASGEGGDVKPVSDLADWPRNHVLRTAPGIWNEDEFVHLDNVLAEAARNHIRVQLCLTNWWRDTGGVTQYLRWVGIKDAADDRYPFGINNERAMLFYTNADAKRLYKEHIEKLTTRRNTVTGLLYRDDPTIFGWELMNEAQATTGRWEERRAWIAEMSAYLKTLDPNHLVAPGDWGYRTSAERREWLADHGLRTIDYCDVHNYPRDDHDSFVDTPDQLKQFIDNRVAATYALGKPLVFGEFGMGVDGHNGFSQIDWYNAFFEGNAQAGSGGAMFWIITPDPARGYGVTYTTARDQMLLSEVTRAAAMFAKLAAGDIPELLKDPLPYLIPRQVGWQRAPATVETTPQVVVREDKSVLYRFTPEMATAETFEKTGGGPGYIWGSGSGFLEYTTPERSDRRRVSEIVVRAHIQPVLPVDATNSYIKTRVTLFMNGWNCGSRLIQVEPTGQAILQEWRMTGWLLRFRAMRGLPLTVRFSVTPDADWLYGVNISNWPEGYDAKDAKPIELELRH
ncbi:MAG: cellulase family glycosylhydrolase [Pyrinomonadaceae bacterium]